MHRTLSAVRMTHEFIMHASGENRNTLHPITLASRARVSFNRPMTARTMLLPVLLTLLCLSVTVQAAEVVAQAPSSAPVSAATTGVSHLPGITLAEGVSQITGTAVSPLLGVSAVGAYKYATTPVEQRHLLPWYCHPWIWGVGLAVIGVCFLKDFLGAAAPPLVKKPLDFVELFEDKLSALVTSAAFVPLVTAAMAQMDSIQPRSAALAPVPSDLAMVQLAVLPDVFWIKMAVYTPVALFIFAIVWMTCHAINVLIALSPFGIVDAGLKLVKLALLGVITGSAFIHPLLGLVVCVPIIVVAAFLAGPAFRLMVFGNVFGWDLLFGRKATSADLEHGVKSFNARRVGSAPVRTYGELHVNEAGTMIFRYRPWLFLPSREVKMDAATASAPDGICEGVLYHSLTRQDDRGRAQSAFILLPRYKDCVTHLSSKLRLLHVCDSQLLRGFKAMRNWLVDALSIGRAAVGRMGERPVS